MTAKVPITMWIPLPPDGPLYNRNGTIRKAMRLWLYQLGWVLSNFNFTVGQMQPRKTWAQSTYPSQVVDFCFVLVRVPSCNREKHIKYFEYTDRFCERTPETCGSDKMDVKCTRKNDPLICILMHMTNEDGSRELYLSDFQKGGAEAKRKLVEFVKLIEED
ncbi:MAG: hypothetical protein AAB431_02450 [Patescibacteria group bacterium]